MIKPYLKGNELLKNIRESQSEDEEWFHLWWLGQSGFLVHWKGQFLLLDPYLSDSLTRKYDDSDKPHIRMTELVIEPSSLDFIQVVTSSHNHTDHLDAETLGGLMKVNHKLNLVIPEANREFVCERLACSPSYPLGLNEKEKLTLGHFTINGIAAAHNQIDRDAQGRCHYLGYVLEFGPWTLYHSGDTLWYEGILEHLRPFDIDVALLPINGHRPERKVAGNLNAEEAVRLAKEAGTRLVIPCHYDMFTFNTADPNDFARIATELGQPFKILQCGEPWSSRKMPQ